MHSKMNVSFLAVAVFLASAVHAGPIARRATTVPPIQVSANACTIASVDYDPSTALPGVANGAVEIPAGLTTDQFTTLLQYCQTLTNGDVAMAQQLAQSAPLQGILPSDTKLALAGTPDISKPAQAALDISGVGTPNVQDVGVGSPTVPDLGIGAPTVPDLGLGGVGVPDAPIDLAPVDFPTIPNANSLQVPQFGAPTLDTSKDGAVLRLGFKGVDGSQNEGKLSLGTVNGADVPAANDVGLDGISIPSADQLGLGGASIPSASQLGLNGAPIPSADQLGLNGVPIPSADQLGFYGVSAPSQAPQFDAPTLDASKNAAVLRLGFKGADGSQNEGKVSLGPVNGDGIPSADDLGLDGASVPSADQLGLVGTGAPPTDGVNADGVPAVDGAPGDVVSDVGQLLQPGTSGFGRFGANKLATGLTPPSSQQADTQPAPDSQPEQQPEQQSQQSQPEQQPASQQSQPEQSQPEQSQPEQQSPPAQQQQATQQPADGNNGGNSGSQEGNGGQDGNEGDSGTGSGNNGGDAGNNGGDAGAQGSDDGNNGGDAGNNGGDAGNNGGDSGANGGDAGNDGANAGNNSSPSGNNNDAQPSDDSTDDDSAAGRLPKGAQAISDSPQGCSSGDRIADAQNSDIVGRAIAGACVDA